MSTEDTVVAISDPGEVERAVHNRGDRFVVALSNLAAWMFPILVVAITAQVLLRNAGMNQAWLDDLQWWLYGVAVLMGVGYAVTTGSHVRVDILYENFDTNKKNRTDLFAIGWLFLPFTIMCWDVTFGYAQQSIAADEGSDSPNGLHNLWILKSFMNLTFLFIAVACWSALYRILCRDGKPPLWRVLWAAFPSTFFTINLVIYYTLFVIVWAISPAGTSGREITRNAVFGELPLGDYEFTYTTLAGLLISIALVLVLRMRARSSQAEG